MAELLVVGSLVFWLALLAWVVILWALVETEHGFCGFLSTVAYVCVLQFVFNVNVGLWAISNPAPIVAFAAFYFVLGAAWCFWRWYLFAKDALEPYTHMKTEWLVSKGQSEFKSVPDILKEEWGKYLTKEGWGEDRKRLCVPPLVRENKSKVMRWIGYWPISLLSWLFNDMIRRIVKLIYNKIAERLQAIANRVFARVKDDLPENFKL